MPHTTVEARVGAPPEAVYDVIVATDPSRLVQGYGPLPRATGTSDPDGVWGRAGASRTVHFGDGSAARERLVAAERPGHLRYRVTDYTNSLRVWATAAVADWRLTRDGAATRVVWTYAFEPRFALARLALLPVVHGLVRGYMRHILREVARRAELAGGETVRPA